VKPRRKFARGQVRMDFGSDGFLGVGPAEVVVVVLVGYFLLGPTELYRLAKEVGKLVTQLRATATEASDAFSQSMESQLAINEISEAANELQDAFSPFSAQARSQRMGVRAPVEELVDERAEEDRLAAEAEKKLRAELGSDLLADGSVPDLEAPGPAVPVADPAAAAKFENQLSGDWNEKVLAGQGPWGNTPPDLASMAAAKAAAKAVSDDELLEMLGELENDRLVELGRLRQEFEEKAALVDELFALKEETLKDYSQKKAAIEKVMNERSAVV